MNRPVGLPSRDDAGVTLIEMLVTIILLAVVTTLVSVAVIGSLRTVRHNEDETQGLTDVRTVTERLGRDIRDARGVAAGADASHLVLWIDYNSDYRYTGEPNEIITWSLTAASGGHDNVIRQVCGAIDSSGACTSQATTTIEAQTLVSNLAFSYDKVAPATTLVTTAMQYDALIGVSGGATQRQSVFETRLRNVS